MACQKYRNLRSTWQHKSSALFLHKKTIAVTALLKVLLWSTVAVQWTFKMSSMSALFCSLLNSTPSGSCGWFNKTCHVYQHILCQLQNRGAYGEAKDCMCKAHVKCLHYHAHFGMTTPWFLGCAKKSGFSLLSPPPVACGITHNVVIRFMYVYVLKRKHVTLVETKNTWNACSYKC